MHKRFSRICVAGAVITMALCVVIVSCNDGFVLDIGSSDGDAASHDDAPSFNTFGEPLDEPGAGTAILSPITYSGTVIDPRDNDAPVVDAQIQVTFADGTNSGHAVIFSDEDGKVEFIGDTDFDYKITVTKANYITTELWTKRSVCGDLEGTLPPVWLIPEPLIQEGAIAGQIRNAFDNELLEYADLEFRAGLNAPDTGPTLYTAQTSNATADFGKYTVDTMKAGVYSALLTRDYGDVPYVPSTVLVYVLGGRTVNGQHGIMTTVLQQNQMRIVVTWGAVPTDLDSHLWAPCPPTATCNNGNYQHLYFSTRGGALTPWFDLDVDDVTSYGPETTTVYDASDTLGETYNFLMHDYSNGGCTAGCLGMCNSPGFQVDVYAGECVQTFYPTPGSDATVWHVFDAVFDGSGWAVTPIDDYCHDGASSVGPTCF
jgi:hypothetical protein